MRKRHSHQKKLVYKLVILLFSLIFIALNYSNKQTTTKADDEVVVTPKFTPNKPPKKVIGIWMTNGYGLQPNPDYYTVVDTPVTLKTDAGRSVWTAAAGALDGVHYRWWQSTDGTNWTAVAKANNGYKKNFTVTPTEVGTVWYQLDTQYYNYFTGLLLKTHIYSNVAAVHTLADPVDALQLDVTSDDDYLYNTSDKLSNTTYAHAQPTPSDATGTITWSVDNPDLATVDENGLVTANSNSLSGTVRVTATFTNNDGSSIKNYVDIEIGGGLDDQTVKSGSPATFTLQGKTGGDDDDGSSGTGTVNVDWYKYAPGSNTRVKVSSGTDTTYTTPDTTMADDGSYFQAVLTFTSGSTTKTITSNKAKLTVLPSSEPDIEITNKITNDTYQDSANTDQLLNDSTGNDSITYHDTLTNKSTEGILKADSYVIPMLPGTKVNTVQVSGNTLSSDDYQIIPNSDTGADDLVINLDDFSHGDSKDIEVNTTVPDITAKQSFQFTPYVYGVNYDGNVYRQEGLDEEINYITNKVLPKVENIDYGTITAFSKDILKYRPDSLNSPNGIVTADDERRDKQPLKVFVTQNAPLSNNNGDVLPASLRFYSDGNYSEILNNKTQIYQTDNGAALKSIAWDKQNGLLLHIDNNFAIAGQYTTTLNWSFEDSL